MVALKTFDGSFYPLGASIQVAVHLATSLYLLHFERTSTLQRRNHHSSSSSSLFTELSLITLKVSLKNSHFKQVFSNQRFTEMALLQSTLSSHCISSGLRDETCFHASSALAISLRSLSKQKQKSYAISSLARSDSFDLSEPKNISFMSLPCKERRRDGFKVFSKVVEVMSDDWEDEEEGNGGRKQVGNGAEFMVDEERREWRRKIREVMDMSPGVEEETDPVEKQRKMQKLLEEYPLVVNEEDPDWPEDDGDGWGFNLGQFFNNITIKNVKKDDDEDYDSDKEFVWQDDSYIRPIKEITTKDWEETVFKDISPLVVFVHNRYKRPKENEKVREELEKVAHIFWNCGLPSPRCVAVDAVIELDLVAALKVPVFPEVIFTKAGKIIYREKAFRTADELSKIMAFFYYGAAKPPYLDKVSDNQELIPSVQIQQE